MNKSTLISLIVVVAVIASGIYLWKMRAPSAAPISKDNVQVSKVDLAATTGSDRVPSGFPANVPLETENVTDSYNQSYPDQGVTIRGYTYFTSKASAEVLQDYKAYFAAEGYILGEEKTSGGANFLTGRKNRDELLVIVSVRDGQTQVQLTYTDIQ